MSLLIHAYQGVIEEIEYEYEPGQTVKSCLQRFFIDIDIQQDLSFVPKVDQLIIVDFKQQTRRIQPEQIIDDLTGESQSILELMIVYPSEPKGALIQFRVNHQKCYFSNLVNKSETLQKYIDGLVKNIGIGKDIEIQINGKPSSPESELEKKLIKKLIALGNSQRIFVEIDQKARLKKKVQKKEVVPDIKQEKKEQDKKEEVKHIQEVRPGLIDVKKEVIKPQNGQLLPSPEKKASKEMSQKMKNGQENKAPKEVECVKLLKRSQEKYNFAIFFETQSGQRSLSFDVSPSQTMLETLPQMLTSMAEAGFDWDPAWQDYRDKLSIVYHSTEFLKLDKKFKSILSQQKAGQIFQFGVKRRYEGG